MSSLPKQIERLVKRKDIDALNVAAATIVGGIGHILDPMLVKFASEGDLDMVKFLVCTNYDGATLSNPKYRQSEALVCAARNGHAKTVEFLLPVSEPESDHSCAMRQSARAGNLECLLLLLPHSDPNAIRGEALYFSIFERNFECAKELLHVTDIEPVRQDLTIDGDFEGLATLSSLIEVSDLSKKHSNPNFLRRKPANRSV